jgi:hypothetical protein
MDQEVRREIDGLKQGTTFAAGQFSVNSSVTSTTVTRNGVSAGSVVHATAYSSTAANSDIQRIIPAKGSFVVYHTSNAGIRTYAYSFVTPQS